MIIHIDEKGIKEETKRIQLAEKHLNAFLEHVQTYLGKLTPEEEKRLPVDAKSVVMDNIRSRFEFPNASEKFNLDALGINPNQILSFYKSNFHYWNRYKVEYSEGVYTIADKESHLKRFYTHADTEKKKEIVSKFKQLESLYNSMVELGVDLKLSLFREAVPNLFKGVISEGSYYPNYIKLDDERLAAHLNNLKTFPLTPPKETSKEAFQRLGIKTDRRKV